MSVHQVPTIQALPVEVCAAETLTVCGVLKLFVPKTREVGDAFTPASPLVRATFTVALLPGLIARLTVKLPEPPAFTERFEVLRLMFCV